MKETLEIADGIKNIRIRLGRLQRMASETSQQLTKHENDMKRLESEKLSQTLLDDALQESEFLCWKLRSIAQSFESLENGSLLKTENKKLANRLRTISFMNQSFNQKLTDSQDLYNTQLNQFFEVHDQFRKAVARHNTLKGRV